jgi:hypothetical protein
LSGHIHSTVAAAITSVSVSIVAKWTVNRFVGDQKDFAVITVDVGSKVVNLDVVESVAAESIGALLAGVERDGLVDLHVRAKSGAVLSTYSGGWE